MNMLELQDKELDAVSGGIVDEAIIVGVWLVSMLAIAIASGDCTYNTTGRGDNNGCTGHQC